MFHNTLFRACRDHPTELFTDVAGLIRGVFHGFADRSDVLASALYRMAGSGDERGETKQGDDYKAFHSLVPSVPNYTDEVS
jgi:hypothetical protein